MLFGSSENLMPLVDLCQLRPKAQCTCVTKKMLQFSIAPSCFRKEVRKVYTWPDVEVELYIWVCNLQQHLSHFASQILSDLRVGRTFSLLAFYQKLPCQNMSFKSGWLMHSDCDPFHLFIWFHPPSHSFLQATPIAEGELSTFFSPNPLPRSRLMNTW